MGKDKVIYEGQSVELDVPKIINSDIKITHYTYYQYKSDKVYYEGDSDKAFVLNALEKGTHEIGIKVRTNNGIIERKIIKITVLENEENLPAPTQPNSYRHLRAL